MMDFGTLGRRRMTEAAADRCVVFNGGDNNTSRDMYLYQKRPVE